MDNKRKKRSKKWLWAIPGVLLLLLISIVGGDRFYIYYKEPQQQPDSLYLSTGDIIVRLTSYYLTESDYAQYGCLPGHVAIVMSDTVVAADNIDVHKIEIAESSVISRAKKRLTAKVRVESDGDNLNAGYGRRLLVKTKLNKDEKMQLKEFIQKNKDKPYYLLATKSDTNSFNCSSFVWHALHEATGIDIAPDVFGELVLPSDILIYYKNKPEYEIAPF